MSDAGASSEFVVLTTDVTSFVLACAIGECPQIVYWGAALRDISPDRLGLMATRQHAHGGPDVEIAASLLNETGSGPGGATGFSAHRGGLAWASRFVVTRVERVGAQEVQVTCVDTQTDIEAVHIINLDADSHILASRTRIANRGDTDLSIDWCAAVSLPLDERATRLMGFTGRWASEFQLEDIPAFKGSYLRENKAGRTSHDSFPGLLAASEHTNETSGVCFGFHLGWSGNHRVRADRLNDGRAFVQMGEYFHPGELVLAPGDTYQTPVLYAGVSATGLSALSRQFHHHLRNTVMDGRIRSKPRPVHFNTWEAVYFDHDIETLAALAGKAADVGVERFILDDGWFGRRRNDRAGLGDWWVSEDVYPNGLGPLVERVTSLGMEFGIWVEPEMVNPDSDLFRDHPDWVLQVEGLEPVASRGQLPLDLTRDEVSAYLFARMDELLRQYDISYVKWDMNRDIQHPGSGGRAVAHKQVHALYGLIDRLRTAHPGVEIETCSSGGGRADYGILERTDRVWVSDSNDALDRQRIQRGASHFLPLEISGSHVGPSPCHITGRRLSMELRVASAFFGHMGVELNLLEESEKSLGVLKQGIELHKQHRALLHHGAFSRIDAPEHVNAVAVMSGDKSEALYSWCLLSGHGETLPGRIYFSELAPNLNYRVRIIWPSPMRSYTAPSIVEACQLDGDGAVFSGEALIHMGLQLPLLYPETCLIFHLYAE